MAYAAESDIDAKWGSELVTLAAWNEGAQSRDEARIADALAGAAALIDGYLAKRYELPLSPAPDGLKLLADLNCDLAIARLSTTPGSRNEIVVGAETAAMALLRDIADGRASVSLISVDGDPIGPEETVLLTGRDTFNPRRMRAL